MMRYFLISFLFLLVTSCALQITKGWVTSKVKQDIVENPYFSDTDTDYVYKAKINIYERRFGGILIIKKIDRREHRVVFTTEFGSKLFDFLYRGECFRKNFVMEELDKKFIVKTLQQDFKLLISEKATVIEQYNNDYDEIFKTSDDKRTNFYFINKKTHTLDKIVNTTINKEKVEVLFKEIVDEEVNKIHISHHNINLQIELEKFANN